MPRLKPIDPKKQLVRLEKKHLQLKAKVRELDDHLFLTAREEVERVRLKKQKLATKDALVDLRRDMSL